MAKVQIDFGGISGLAPKFYGDANDSQGYGSVGRPWLRSIGSSGQMASGCWNPFRAFGYMAPPTSMANSSVRVLTHDATYSINSELRATLYDSVGTDGTNGLGVWVADATNVWYQYTATDPTFALHNIVPLTLNNPRITDLERYQINGVGRIFFAYEEQSGLGGDIGWISPDAGFDNLTWLSSSVSGGFQTGATNNVLMVSADNGYMYILDGSALHKIDGTTAGGVNGTAYPNVLLFPPDFTLVDAVDWQSYLWIAVQTRNPSFNSGVAYNERTVGVYVWDRITSTSATSPQKFIPVPGLREIKKIYVTPQGEVRLIGISSERLTQIRRYNGNTFELVQELGIWAYPQYRDSVTNFGSLVTWLGVDGRMYAHGKLPATQQGSLYYTPDQLYILGDMSPLANNTDLTTGAILTYGVGAVGTAANPPTSLPAIVFGYQDNSGNKRVYQWTVSGTGTVLGTTQKGDAGNVISLVQRLPGLSKVNYIRVWHLSNGNGGTDTMGTLSIFKNQSSAPLSAGAIPITQTDVQRGYRYIDVGDSGAGTFALQIEIAWPTNTTLSDSGDWMPYMIEVDYDETPRKI